jgi:hypothetical protein
MDVQPYDLNVVGHMTGCTQMTQKHIETCFNKFKLVVMQTAFRNKAALQFSSR